MIYLYLFLVGVTIDVFYVLWVHAVNANRTYLAASMSVLLTTCSLFGVINIQRDLHRAVPYLMGIWCGVVLGMKIKDKIK